MKIPKKKAINPMAIIAIFATLSETSAAISLPFLDNQERQIYIWFLISFPFYLLFLFFITLNFNYKSLYAPSDFQKSKQFLKVIDDAARTEKNKDSLALEPRDNDLSAASGKAYAESLTKKHQGHTHLKGKPDYLLQSLQDPPDGHVSTLGDVSAQLQMSRLTSVDCLHIIDARWLRKKKHISSLMERIDKGGNNKKMVVVFLTCSESEHLLNEKALNKSGASILRSKDFACLTYNLSTQAVTEIRRSRNPSSNEQHDK
ncbi:hypothetical protein SAMN04487857_110151 [Pseudomonas sp. ok272]|uniref:hypothetical protein n=1 Tax=unclassified Pseudomonas TaxID=196821 RepID=UPI0008ABE648|nr:MULTISPECIES: hypothetical protein [unclassified Pseudomonas]SEN13762.1 hypothetical protein SAMN04487857_110151 [Pseudomonas sp. ok272]SFN06375.1 hypothetical protein SAMN04487858_111152 [Pseudomonas sp. ok602]